MSTDENLVKMLKAAAGMLQGPGDALDALAADLDLIGDSLRDSDQSEYAGSINRLSARARAIATVYRLDMSSAEERVQEKLAKLNKLRADDPPQP